MFLRKIPPEKKCFCLPPKNVNYIVLVTLWYSQMCSMQTRFWCLYVASSYWKKPLYMWGKCIPGYIKDLCLNIWNVCSQRNTKMSTKIGTAKLCRPKLIYKKMLLGRLALPSADLSFKGCYIFIVNVIWSLYNNWKSINLEITVSLSPSFITILCTVHHYV